jgi:hypothetical protein
MLTARAACALQFAIGIEGIIECGHEISCLTLNFVQQGACQPPVLTISQLTQAFCSEFERSLAATKTRDIRKIVI